MVEVAWNDFFKLGIFYFHKPAELQKKCKKMKKKAVKKKKKKNKPPR